MSEEKGIEQAKPRTVLIPSSSPRAIEWAAEEIASGGVVAIPTDTVYGLAASLAHPEAIERIFAIKGRDSDRRLPVLLSSVDALEHVSTLDDRRVLRFFDEFWPGPMTVVIPSGRSLPDRVLGADDTVAVRVPNHPLAIEVIEKAGGAVACTSANRSSDLPALRASDVERTIGPELDMILDGGVAPGGLASTIVRIRGDALEILREGPIEASLIESAWASCSSEV